MSDIPRTLHGCINKYNITVDSLFDYITDKREQTIFRRMIRESIGDAISNNGFAIRMRRWVNEAAEISEYVKIMVLLQKENEMYHRFAFMRGVTIPLEVHMTVSRRIRGELTAFRFGRFKELHSFISGLGKQCRVTAQ
jgi:hypothetical protein